MLKLPIDTPYTQIDAFVKAKPDGFSLDEWIQCGFTVTGRHFEQPITEEHCVDTWFSPNDYPKDSMDRFGDDLCSYILSFFDNKTQVVRQCVSKQWQRCMFQMCFMLTVKFMFWNENMIFPNILDLFSNPILSMFVSKFNRVKKLELETVLNLYVKNRLISELRQLTELSFTGGSFRLCDNDSYVFIDKLPKNIKKVLIKSPIVCYPLLTNDTLFTHFCQFAQIYGPKTKLLNLDFIRLSVYNKKIIEFLKYFSNVESITIYFCEIDESFLKEIIKHFPFLSTLYIYANSKSVCNYSKFIVNKQLIIESTYNILENNMSTITNANKCHTMFQTKNFDLIPKLSAIYCNYNCYDFINKLTILFADESNFSIKIHKNTKYFVFNYVYDTEGGLGETLGHTMLINLILLNKVQHLLTRKCFISNTLINLFIHNANVNPSLHYSINNFGSKNSRIVNDCKNLMLNID